MTIGIIPERLAQLDELHLDRGSHFSFEDGHCAMEVVAWLAGEDNTDAPACASPVLRRYMIVLNDRWSAERRQALKPFLPRMIGTGSDGKDGARTAVTIRFLCIDLLEPWLRLAGMDEQADSLAGLTEAAPDKLWSFLYETRHAAWRRRDAAYVALRAKIGERLAKHLSAATATAAAAATDAAVFAAAAAAAATATATAIFAAAAAAAAAAGAATDAAASAAVSAAADAAADAADAGGVALSVALSAAADAAAAATAATDAAVSAAAAAVSSDRYRAAYNATSNYFREHPLPIHELIQELGVEQQPLALVLLERLIDPEAAV